MSCSVDIRVCPTCNGATVAELQTALAAANERAEVPPSPRPMMSVIRPGTPVSVNGIKATVLCVTIRPDYGVSYLCTWFNGREKVEEWMYSSEVDVASPGTAMMIGFKP